jgi:hypothetical protein
MIFFILIRGVFPKFEENSSGMKKMINQKTVNWKREILPVFRNADRDTSFEEASLVLGNAPVLIEKKLLEKFWQGNIIAGVWEDTFLEDERFIERKYNVTFGKFAKIDGKFRIIKFFEKDDFGKINQLMKRAFGYIERVS